MIRRAFAQNTHNRARSSYERYVFDVCLSARSTERHGRDVRFFFLYVSFNRIYF